MRRAGWRTVRFAVLATYICAAPVTALAQAGEIPNGLPDPTRPYHGGGRTPADLSSMLKVQSILIAHDRRSAVINGRIVAEGSRVNGARVETIGADHVRLDYQGTKITLPLLRQDVVTRARPKGTQP